MRKKSIIFGMILSLVLVSACGSKAPASIDTSVSDTESSISEEGSAPSLEVGAKNPLITGDSSKTSVQTETEKRAEENYNEAGELISKVEYGEEGYDTFEYNNDGLIAEQKGFDENGDLLYTITNEYDENGNITKGVKESADGTEKVTEDYEYDKSGQLSEIVTDFGDGYQEKDVYVRDSAGREIEYRYVSIENGKETEIQKITKEYDDHGNVILETYFSMGKKAGETKYVYTYDGAGNILTQETIRSDGLSDKEEKLE